MWPCTSGCRSGWRGLLGIRVHGRLRARSASACGRRARRGADGHVGLPARTGAVQVDIGVAEAVTSAVLGRWRGRCPAAFDRRHGNVGGRRGRADRQGRALYLPEPSLVLGELPQASRFNRAGQAPGHRPVPDAMAGHSAGGAAAIAAMLADAASARASTSTAPLPPRLRPRASAGRAFPGQADRITPRGSYCAVAFGAPELEATERPRHHLGAGNWECLTRWKRWLLVAGTMNASFTGLALLAGSGLSPRH